MSLKLYLAALYASGFHLTSGRSARQLPEEKWWRENLPYHLESYFWIQKQTAVDHIRKDGFKIFLDSGAFSAMSKKVTINLKAYCDYIKRNEDIIEKVDGILVASVLDGIGDAQLTYENQEEMERQGVKPLPCFHFGEDPRYLDYYTSKYSYITLGGMVRIPVPQLIQWLDRMWDRHLVDSAGRPKVRVHGFGMTNLELMKRYPWYSVDSSSWAQIGSFGNILVPGFGVLPISDDSPKIKQKDAHFNTISPALREKVTQEIESKHFQVERLRKLGDARWIFNCVSFNEIAYSINTPKLIRDQKRLFD